jgi:hypothetical protein
MAMVLGRLAGQIYEKWRCRQSTIVSLKCRIRYKMPGKGSENSLVLTILNNQDVDPWLEINDIYMYFLLLRCFPVHHFTVLIVYGRLALFAGYFLIS